MSIIQPLPVVWRVSIMLSIGPIKCFLRGVRQIWIFRYNIWSPGTVPGSGIWIVFRFDHCTSCCLWGSQLVYCIVCLFVICYYYYYYYKHTGMSCIKPTARQANTIYLYRNVRSKLLRRCANIYFNKQCLSKKAIPKYANNKFAKKSPAAHITTKKAQITQVKMT